MHLWGFYILLYVYNYDLLFIYYLSWKSSSYSLSRLWVIWNDQQDAKHVLALFFFSSIFSPAVIKWSAFCGWMSHVMWGYNYKENNCLGKEGSLWLNKKILIHWCMKFLKNFWKNCCRRRGCTNVLFETLWTVISHDFHSGNHYTGPNFYKAYLKQKILLRKFVG